METGHWDDSLSIGVRLIDEQHRALIQKLDDVSEATKANVGESEIVKALVFLADYARFHFSSEEEYMTETGYSGLAEQQQMHGKFMETLKNLEDDFQEEGSTKNLANAINTFLMNWLARHIKVLDRKFADFLSKRDSAGSD